MQDLTLARLREFHQLKERIRCQESHLLVGIDVAKGKHYAFFGTATERMLFKRLIFENNKQAL